MFNKQANYNKKKSSVKCENREGQFFSHKGRKIYIAICLQLLYINNNRKYMHSLRYCVQ